MKVKMKPKQNKSLSECTFCGEIEVNRKFMVIGPQVNICDECVFLCVDILAERGIKKP